MPVLPPTDPIDPRIREKEVEFKQHVRRMLDYAVTSRWGLNSAVQAWRRNVRMERRPVTPWADAPNITSPLTRQKTDGVEANILAALDQEPFFAARPLSDEAQYHQTAFEAVMEKEMDRSQARTAIHAAIQDAVVCGTGHLRHEVVEDPFSVLPDGSPGFNVGERSVRFEDCYAYPTEGINKRTPISHFERMAKPWWQLKQEGEDDRAYDLTRLEKIKSAAGVTNVGYESSKEVNAAYSNTMDDEERYHEIWHCEVWWKGEIWWVEYHRVADEILAAYPNPWAQLFNYTSYRPVYIKPRPGFYYGDCIPEVIEPLQEVADALLNTELAAGQFKMQPPILVRRGSALARTLKKKGYIPGGIIEVDGAFSEHIQIQDMKVNPFNVEFLQLVSQMAEDATFNDLTMPGSIVPGDRTATEVQVIQSMGSLKLRIYLMHIRDCLKAFAADKWNLVFEYVIKPNGVYSPYGTDTTQVATVDALVFNDDGSMTGIPGGLRDDLQWEVRGNETAPGKQARAQQVSQLIAQYPIFLQARTDRGMYFLCKALLELSGILGYKEIIGTTPPPPVDFVQALQQQMMQQLQAQLPAGSR